MVSLNIKRLVQGSLNGYIKKIVLIGSKTVFLWHSDLVNAYS